jgi:hypothetical protein
MKFGRGGYRCQDQELEWSDTPKTGAAPCDSLSSGGRGPNPKTPGIVRPRAPNASCCRYEFHASAHNPRPSGHKHPMEEDRCFPPKAPEKRQSASYLSQGVHHSRLFPRWSLDNAVSVTVAPLQVRHNVTAPERLHSLELILKRKRPPRSKVMGPLFDKYGG